MFRFFADPPAFVLAIDDILYSMTIADTAGLDKGSLGRPWERLISRIPRIFLVLGLILLCGSGTFALGRVYEREEGRGEPDATLWIENLPQSEIPAAAAASLEEKKASVKSTSTSKAVSETTPTPEQPAVSAGGEVVASKNGGSYYLPSCSGVKRISPENLVTFSSKEAAEAKGYKPAKTCKGL